MTSVSEAELVVGCVDQVHHLAFAQTLNSRHIEVSVGAMCNTNWRYPLTQLEGDVLVERCHPSLREWKNGSSGNAAAKLSWKQLMHGWAEIGPRDWPHTTHGQTASVHGDRNFLGKLRILFTPPELTPPDKNRKGQGREHQNKENNNTCDQ